MSELQVIFNSGLILLTNIKMYSSIIGKNQAQMSFSGAKLK